MSHFTTIVLLNKDNIGLRSDQDTIHQALDKALAPYDENEQVEPYKKYIEDDEIVRMAEHYDDITLPEDWRRTLNLMCRDARDWDRAKFNNYCDEHNLSIDIDSVDCSNEESIAEIDKMVEERDRVWQSDFLYKTEVLDLPHSVRVQLEGENGEQTDIHASAYTDLRVFIQSVLDNLEDWDGYAGGCDSHGFYYWCTYNPKSKWDWYVVGGRWDGGVGGGYLNNIRAVKDMLDKDEVYIPFALVTPAGFWYERARMGWWAITSDEKDPDQWDETVRALYAYYSDSVAVLVDCHI